MLAIASVLKKGLPKGSLLGVEKNGHASLYPKPCMQKAKKTKMHSQHVNTPV